MRFLVGKKIWLAVVVALVCAPAYATSAPFFLNFQYLKNLEPIANFYNGGTGGLGSYAGMNKDFGVTFSSNTLGLRSYLNSGSGNFASTPLGLPAIFFNSGTSGYMNVAGGFTTGLNFFYTSLAPITVTVWSGANGTGNVLATITLGVNSGTAGGCTGAPLYCNWSDIAVAFSGTATSVTFRGASNYLGLSDITVGSTRTAIPEPTTLLLLGSGLVAIASVRLRRARQRLTRNTGQS
jgi:hypothetical protein